MNQREEIVRAELVATIVDASEGVEGVAPSTAAKLREVAETTDAVAVGWWHCDGVDCPARQAGRKNQRFQELFDRAMCERFGRHFNEDPHETPTEPFVVEVKSA